MGLKIVEIAIDALECLENSVPSVNHVIVHRNSHKKWMGDHSPQYAAIHGQITIMVRLDKILCQTLAIP
jgi:hypothetical protein